MCICCVQAKKFFEIKVNKKLLSTYYRLPRLPDMSMVSIKIEVARNTDDVTNDLDTLKLKKVGF